MARDAVSIAPDGAGLAALGATRVRLAEGAASSAAVVASGAPLATAALAWLAGVALQLQERTLLPARAYGALLALAAGLLALRWARRQRTAARHPAFGATGLAIVAVVAGFAAAGWRAADRLADTLPTRLEGRDLQVTGVVAGLPQRGPSGLRFRFEVESAALAGQPVALPPGLSLGWYKGFHEDAVLTQPQLALAAGQRWRFTLRLRQPHGNLNPHGFDSELLLFEQGIRAVGYVRDAPAPQLLERTAGYPLERWRQRVRDAIEARIADPRIAGVLAALAVGDQSAIGRDDWALFRDTGIAHLVSISGLHVTMFAWLAGAAIAAGWRRSRRAALWLPAQTAGLWGGLAAALGYALLSGFGVPSQRTVWMLAVVTLLRSGGCRWPWPLTLLAAAVAVTLFDPWALLQAGFWLSFMAVGLLMASAGVAAPSAGPARSDAAAARAAEAAAAAEASVGGRLADNGGPADSGSVGGHGRDGADDGDGGPAATHAGWRGRLVGWRSNALAALHGGLRTQLIATIGLAPLSLVFFQQLSLVGFLANLLAIPVISLLVTPLALLGTLAWPLWRLGGWAIERLIGWLQWLQGWPGAVWWAPAAPVWAQLAGLAGAVLSVAPLPWRVRALALPLLLPLLMPPLERPPAGQFDLLAADVGQGTAVLVRTRRHLLVYDAGPRYSRDGDAGERVLLPLLRAGGEDRIDRLVLSHRDSDHTGGAVALLRGLPVAALSSSLESGHPLLLEAASRGIPVERCAAGQHWRWDGVDFDLLAPPAASYERALPSNALSCVLRIRAVGGAATLAADVDPAHAPATGFVGALLTGDIESAQEAALVAADAGTGNLRSQVLVAPHHGSKTSSTADFIEAVSPRVAVFQAGYRSRFGHPAPEVLARYAEHGVERVASPACGAWSWRSAAAPIAPQPASAVPTAVPAGVCERDRRRRYWHHVASASAAG